ncbi:hypothetical protein [Bosea sp. (in: a-proteobacteria)]|jgi:hypothetical protein|uniref:hypothetical protein n=1 Tax=Bosea sp. (in: a-proteobacteria) TaxID=1871050 RepID=UPI002DDD3750|nr:hypothetical protein [Bosea sp. (in: a-proteobacteria)]HEV2508655.1 hypothetical protein [Bosea sp. (in: a-proteobacteria)]
MSAFNRRAAIKGVLTSVAVTVPALPPGGALAPAAASILKAAPYVPASDDAELLGLSARFHQICAEQEALWVRCCAMVDASSPEAEALDKEAAGMYDAWAGTSDACYTMTPTTPAGAAALLGVILERDADFIDDEPKQALRNLHTALAAMVLA